MPLGDVLALKISFLGRAGGLSRGTSFLGVPSCPGGLAIRGMMVLHNYEVWLGIVSFGSLEIKALLKAERNGMRSNRVR